MSLLASVLLATVAATAPPLDIVAYPGEIATVVVLDPALAPLQGVALSLHIYPPDCSVDSAAPPVRQQFALTNAAGQARIVLPEPGQYSLRISLSGFLTTTLGPFMVCPSKRASCGPSLLNPTKVILQPAVFFEGLSSQ